MANKDADMMLYELYDEINRQRDLRDESFDPDFKNDCQDRIRELRRELQRRIEGDKSA